MSASDEFTGIEDTDRLILMEFSAGDIINLCAVNKHFSKLCNDVMVWKYITGRDYGEDMINYAKIENMTARNFYLHLRTLFKGQTGERLFKGKNNTKYNAMVAAENGYIPLLADIFSRHKFKSADLSHVWNKALTNCQVETVEWFIDESIIDDYNIEGSLLHPRICVEMAQLLLEKGADVHRENDNPLEHAVGEKNRELAQLYIDHGADPSKMERKTKQWLRSQQLIK